MRQQTRMQPANIARRVATISLFALIAGACAAQTQLEQQWTAAAGTQPPLQNVMTVFVADNVTMRRAGEVSLAAAFNKRGVRATPGYRVLGDQTDIDAAKAKARAMGYDGLVVMKIIDKEQQLEYSPGWDGYWGYGYGWYGGWPGYAYTETIYRIETTAYSLQTGQLVWSGISKTTDPSNASELVQETTEMVAGNLTKRGLAG